MNSLLLVAGLASAAAVILLLVAARGLLREVPQEERNYQDPLPAGLRLIWPLVTAATYLVGPRLKASHLEKAHRSLQTAGQDFVLKPEELYGLRLVSAAMAGAFLVLTASMLGKGTPGVIASCAAFGGLLGWLYPSLWLGERRNVRRRQIVRDLPVYLDFITMSVEAGLNLTGAIEQAILKGPAGALSQEFARVLRDMRAGLPRSEALRRMSDRMDISQITNFTSALVQADRVGASLSETLRAQAMQRREERFLRAEKLALEAPVKMMLPLVMFFFPLIFLVLGYFIYLQMRQEGIL